MRISDWSSDVCSSDLIGAPILITQHLPDVFMPFFARQIAAASGRRAQVAVEGIPLQAEQIFIAPGDAHLCLARGGRGVCVSLSRAPASSGCLPSVDNMPWSVRSEERRGGKACVSPCSSRWSPYT